MNRIMNTRTNLFYSTKVLTFIFIGKTNKNKREKPYLSSKEKSSPFSHAYTLERERIEEYRVNNFYNGLWYLHRIRNDSKTFKLNVWLLYSLYLIIIMVFWCFIPFVLADKMFSFKIKWKLTNQALYRIRSNEFICLIYFLHELWITPIFYFVYKEISMN